MSSLARVLARLFAVGGILVSAQGLASTVTVPDAFTTVQAAIDSGADTVLIRDGTYAEIPQAYRGVTMLGTGSRRPVLAGLAVSNAFHWLSRRWTVKSIDFEGPVTLTTSNPLARLLEMVFVDCNMRGGLLHDLTTNTDPYDIDAILVANCRLGAPSVVSAAQISLQADTLDGGISIDPEAALAVQSCWFRGGFGVALHISGADPSGPIEDNVFEQHASGILAVTSRGLVIRSNVIRQMDGYGIDVSGDGGIISDNVVTDCGNGIRCNYFGVTLTNNTCLRIRGTGIRLDEAQNLRLEHNVVGRCGNDGVIIEFGDGGNFRLAQNTILENTGSGIALLYGADNTMTVEGNIFFANSEWGLDIRQPQASITLGCNDWFGNGAGNARGVVPGGGDLFLDPLFCQSETDDVTLFASSPLAAHPTCGQIGAKGVGCSITATTLTRLSVTPERDRIVIQWGFGASSPPDSWVERALYDTGPWDSLGSGLHASGNEYVFYDRDVSADQVYLYRVTWREGLGVVHSAPVGGKLSGAGPLTLVMPNPSFGELAVEWTIATPTELDVRVFDLAGREVATIAKGRFGAGHHRARWDGLQAGGHVAPAGWYVVRVGRGDTATHHRILLIR